MVNNLTELDYRIFDQAFCSRTFVDAFKVARVDDERGAEILGRKRSSYTSWNSIAFPHYDIKTGKLIDYCLKPDDPEKEKQPDGSEKPKYKYLFPPGRGGILYYPPFTPAELLTDISKPVVFTEGKKQLIAITRLATNNSTSCDNWNFLPIATNGVWGWKKTGGRGVKGPAPMLDDISFEGRKVILCPDADMLTNESVQAATNSFAKLLTSRGAKVSIAKLPQMEGFKGIDDVLGLWEREKGLEEAVKRGLALFDNAEPSVPNKKESQATRILNFASDLKLFHTPDGDAFATIETPNGHFENHYLRSKAFRSWLAFQFFQTEGQMPSTQALQDALNTLEGKAIFEGKEVELFVRLASVNDKIYLDLCNKSWQIVEISKYGWQVIESGKAPVKFYRTKAMLPLPTPVNGGDAKRLSDFLNVDKNTFILILLWLVNCFRPGFPFPVIIIMGEQGTAKSTLSRMLRRLIDPNKTDFRSAPRDERDLILAATNAWLCAYDNLSSIPAWLSDALCRISTGGGFSTRTLYENTEETIFSAKRPILLNGIGSIADKGDLLDRAILVSLKPIPKDKRKTESEFWSEFERHEVSIFSGLLDAVSEAMKNVEMTRLDNYPRMADFAQFATAAERFLGFGKNEFMQAFEENKNGANYVALEGSPLAETIQCYAAKHDEFEGNLQEFLDALKPLASEETLKSKDYPKTPRGLRSKLERINPNLRAIGIHIEFLERTNKGQLLNLRTLEQVCNQPSQPSQPSPVLETKDLSGDGRGDGWNAETPTVTQPSLNRHDDKPSNNNGLGLPSDGGDVCDGSTLTRSKEEIIHVKEVF